MRTRPALTFDDVHRIAAAAAAEAQRNQWPVTIAICDDGGHLLLLHRLDGVATVSFGLPSVSFLWHNVVGAVTVVVVGMLLSMGKRSTATAR